MLTNSSILTKFHVLVSSVKAKFDLIYNINNLTVLNNCKKKKVLFKLRLALMEYAVRVLYIKQF